MRIPKLCIAGLMVAALCSASFASPQALSTSKERVRFVRIARNLELKPLSFNAVQQRQWATEFIVRARDLHIELCDGVITAPLKRANENYNSQLSMQFMVSSAAFMIEHPKVKDPVKIQTAGVEGTLKAYQSILKVDKNVRFEFLDGLMQQKKDGQLENYVASLSHVCGDLMEQAPQHRRRFVP